jgi:hypothetical protein
MTREVGQRQTWEFKYSPDELADAMDLPTE